MGAIPFIVYNDNVSAREAFNSLVSEVGKNDPYNGSISTCTLGRVEYFADVYKPSLDKKITALIDERDNGEKWVAHCLDCGLVGYLVGKNRRFVKTSKQADRQPVHRYVFYGWGAS